MFYSQSDIPGLHIEAATFDEFVALVRDLAPEMIADNFPQHILRSFPRKRESSIESPLSRGRTESAQALPDKPGL